MSNENQGQENVAKRKPGRPKGEPKKKVLLALPEDLAKGLEEAATAAGMSRNSLIVKVLTDHVNEKKG